MKKRNLFLVALLGLVATSTLTSCKKKGCTDANAENYYDKAKKDDGSCTYKTSVAFYYTQATADSMWIDGSTSLYFYIDNKLIGSSAADTYWSKPSCGKLGPVSYAIDLGKEKSKTVSYKVVDDTGFVINSGNTNVSGGSCTILEVVYP